MNSGVENESQFDGAGTIENKEQIQQEIERRFLVKELPKNYEILPGRPIVQGYLAVEADSGAEVRLRKEGNGPATRYYQTVKIGKGRKRLQPEVQISQEIFDQFWPVTEGRQVQKFRYFLEEAGRTYEIDIYENQLSGLQTTDVEFDTDEEAEAFQPPEWFGREITDDARFNNKNLASHGLPEEFQMIQSNRAKQIPVYELDRGVGVLVDLIKDLRMAAGDNSVIVQIAGGSASGKTSAVAKTVKEVFGEQAMILSMDDYYRGKRHMDAEAERGNVLNWDHPGAIELELLCEHLGDLKKGKTVSKPKYSFKTGEREGYENLEPAKIIILEGLFALSDEIKDQADLKAFVDIGMHGRVMRRLLRDVHRTSMSPGDILRYFAEVVEPMHEQFVQTTKRHADLIISNEYNPKVEAGRAGVNEVQLKFSGKIAPETLRKAGAERLSGSRQFDYYYHPSDRNLMESGELLRIRQEEESIVLTYKGPLREASKFRERPKFECEIDAPTRDVFLRMYGERVKIIEKYRVVYKLGDVVMTQDHVRKIGLDQKMEELGDFVEVRCDSSAEKVVDLGVAMEKLGLEIRNGLKMAYSEM